MTYKYEIWYDGNMLTEYGGFENEEDAMEEANWDIERFIEFWKGDECYYGVTNEDFEIEIEEEQLNQGVFNDTPFTMGKEEKS